MPEDSAADRDARGTGSPPAQGSPLTIVKLRPDGSEAARYPGKVRPSPRGWVAIEARWGYQRMDLGYVVYEPNDLFLEYFSLDQPYNAFAVYGADGGFKGWYCNVTHPSWVESDTLYWHDLYLDVIVTSDGTVQVLDEDELAASGLVMSDPRLHAMILSARDRLLQMVREQAYPFSEQLLS